MAVIGNLKVLLTGDTAGLEKSLARAERSAMRTARKLESSGRALSYAVTAPLVAISGFSVKAASDAEETASKFATVFQSVAKEADIVAASLADNYGLASSTSKQLLADTGDLLSGFGFTGQAALDMAQQVNTLAIDLASFTNFSGGAKGASAALTKALLGERESVKSLGIAILEKDVVERVALERAQGLHFATERQAKAHATLSLAIAQSKNAIGDYDRTSGSTANTMRRMAEQSKVLRESFGRLLIDGLKLTSVMESATRWIQSVSESLHVVSPAAIVFVAAIGPVMLVVSKLITAGVTISQTFRKLYKAMVIVKTVDLSKSMNDTAAAMVRAKLQADGLDSSLMRTTRSVTKLGKVAGVAGAAFAGWNVGRWISQLKIGGATIEDRIANGMAITFGWATKLDDAAKATAMQLREQREQQEAITNAATATLEIKTKQRNIEAEIDAFLRNGQSRSDLDAWFRAIDAQSEFASEQRRIAFDRASTAEKINILLERRAHLESIIADATGEKLWNAKRDLLLADERIAGMREQAKAAEELADPVRDIADSVDRIVDLPDTLLAGLTQHKVDLVGALGMALKGITADIKVGIALPTNLTQHYLDLLSDLFAMLPQGSSQGGAGLNIGVAFDLPKLTRHYIGLFGDLLSKLALIPAAMQAAGGFKLDFQVGHLGRTQLDRWLKLLKAMPDKGVNLQVNGQPGKGDPIWGKMLVELQKQTKLLDKQAVFA